ncbi:MAG TPA: DUF983 domain-containing protein [Caulobacteraceae bacterium]|jgi:uncharacterized protein (DUF983 family)|nr:DUF983 domain-containing protein [Caulobacteraceae bacterium]
MTQDARRRPNPVLAGLKGRCPNCGAASMFSGFLRIADRCPACGFDLRSADAGDGPAVFIILVAGFICAFGALFSEMAFNAPPWLLLLIWLPVSAVLCLALLRPFKGVLVALQFHHKAGELRNDDF